MKATRTIQLVAITLIIAISCEIKKTEQPPQAIMPEADCPEYFAKGILDQVVIRYDECAVSDKPKKIKEFRKKLKDELNIDSVLAICKCDSNLILYDASKSPIVDPNKRVEAVNDRLKPEGLGDAFPNFQIFLDYIPKYAYLDSTQKENVSFANEVKVAVIDAGLDETLFSDYMWENSSDCGDAHGINLAVDTPTNTNHGTLVSSIIVNKVSPGKLKLMNLRIFDNGGNGNLFNATCAISFAINNDADIINTSWGYYNDQIDPTFFEYIQATSAKDIIVVSSAGNDSLDTDKCNHYPSGFDEKKYHNSADNVISVAYLNLAEDSLHKNSNWGKKSISLAAKGVYKFTHPSNETVEGSSFAAPNVTRAAAIIKGEKPNLNHREVIRCVLEHNITDININVDTEAKLNSSIDASNCQ